MTDQNDLIAGASEQISAPRERATFRVRFFAYLIDMVILGILTGCINLLGVQNILMGLDEQAQIWLSAAGGIIFLIIPAIYFIWPYSTNGQTLGKRAMKIKVVSADGSPLNLGQGIARTIGYLCSCMPFSLGYLWCLKDANKQTWHDKMAGTYVVPVSITTEQFQGSIDAAGASRKRKPWLFGLGIPTILLVILGYSGFFIFVNRGVSEVQDMGPWPGTGVSPEAVISLDLSHLGLEMQNVRDARDQADWAEGNYEEGVLVTYGANEQVVVVIWAMRYKNSQTASNDYSSVQAYAEPSCVRSVYAYTGNSGIVHCQFSDAYQKILWHGNWIVSILALNSFMVPPDQLVDQVRDAIAAHWQINASP